MFNDPLFGVILTIIAFEIGKLVYRKTRWPLCNPILIATFLVVMVLIVFKVPLEKYERGSNMISFYLGPVTVALAVPLYKNINLIKSNFIPIVVGIVVGIITATSSVIIIGKFLHLDEKLILSMAPKSITTPIGMNLSNIIGGIESITVITIVITGISGGVLAPIICRLFKIKNKVAIGIGIGTASHAVGTAKAIEMGEVEGAMSGLAIGLSGLGTIFILPLVLKMLF